MRKESGVAAIFAFVAFLGLGVTPSGTRAYADVRADVAPEPLSVQTSESQLPFSEICKILGQILGLTPAELIDEDPEIERPETAPASDETTCEESRQALLRGFVDSLKDCETDFFFSFSPQGLQRMFEVGEPLQFNIIAESDGYLSVLAVKPGGRVDVLLSPNGVDDRWKSNSNETLLPREGDPCRWTAAKPCGDVRFIAVVTKRPLYFDDAIVDAANEDKVRTIEALKRDVLGWCGTTVYVDDAEASERNR